MKNLISTLLALVPAVISANSLVVQVPVISHEAIYADVVRKEPYEVCSEQRIYRKGRSGKYTKEQTCETRYREIKETVLKGYLHEFEFMGQKLRKLYPQKRDQIEVSINIAGIEEPPSRIVRVVEPTRKVKVLDREVYSKPRVYGKRKKPTSGVVIYKDTRHRHHHKNRRHNRDRYIQKRDQDWYRYH